MAWRGVAWLCALGACVAGVQPYGGPQFGGAGQIEFLTAGGQPGTAVDRVKALSASTLLQIPGQPGPPSTRQEAKFKLKAVWEPAEGWGLAGFEWQYFWQPPGGPAIPADALTIIEGQFNQYATGRAALPGIFWAKVGIRRQHPGGYIEPVGQPGVWLSAQCCAFGGPLQLGVTGREPGDKTQTWLQIGRVSSANNTANSEPWYLQYFGYAPDAAVPAGYQQTQDAAAALKYSQPEGVEWVWMNVPGTWSETLAGWPTEWPDPPAVDRQATEAFEGREVKCEFYADVELLDGFQSGGSVETYPAGLFSNTGEDDTEQSLYEVVPNTPYPPNLKMVSKITAAEPGELTRIENFPYDPSANPFRRCGRKVRCNLKDTASRNMPGVLCQERFPEPNEMPPGVAVNTEAQAWYTLHFAGIEIPNGNWNRYDELRYVWPPGPPYPYYDFPQEYWVATKSLTQGGILKRSWTIKLTQGQPGTCEQDES
ncbi:MAG: hypothetical protein IT207_01680 [Fimbriimonadaceae bacterium]|nr:hypothetical protein [Fimbriimonadaceae bacterium]